MEKTLTVGKTYTVTTASECAVTDSNGLVLCTATAGEQKAFVATTTTITFSDDSATVTAVFKGAPAALGMLGGGNSGGSGGGGGIEGDYLTYDANGVVTGGRMNEVTDISYMFHSVARQKEWNIPVLPKVTNAANAFQSSGITNLNIELPECLNAGAFMHGTKSMVEANIRLAKATAVAWFGYASNVARMTFYAPKAREVNSAFRAMRNLTYLNADISSARDVRDMCTDSSQLSEIHLQVSPQGIYYANAAFSGCVLNKESALHVFSLLSTSPGGNGASVLNIGIHIDHQDDADILAAVDAATSLGWVVAVQWNGTASS